MKRYLVALLLICFCPLLLLAQELWHEDELMDTIYTNVDLFEEIDPLDFTLTFNIKEYLRKKHSEEYVPVELVVHFNDTIDVHRNMRIKARGEFRKSTCYFSPFWLNINKANIENKYLQDVKKMKVVTHCRNGSEYEEYILLEYLAYKIYNILSPVSFRVRLIDITYVDTGRKNKVTHSWAFLIEPEKMLAERFSALAIKNDKLAMVYMRPGEMLLASLFQYMIGNCDYSVTGRHNIKILGLPGYGSEGYTPVPYDFDYAGLVDASYAIPGEDLGITSVTQRYYLGPCREDAEYQSTMQHLKDHREEILELVQEFPYLSEKGREKAIAYIESYYIDASDPDFIKWTLSSSCR